MRKKDKPDSQSAAATAEAETDRPDADTTEPAAEDSAADTPDSDVEQAGADTSAEGDAAAEPADGADDKAADGTGDAQEDAPQETGDTQEDAPAQPEPAEAAVDPEKAQMKADLLQARSKLAAYEAGVAPDKVADAVTLAMAQVRADGADMTEEAVAAAMKDVIKRNPEWKAGGNSKAAGGFRLGSDPDQPAAKKTAPAPGTQKRWNKFNRES